MTNVSEMYHQAGIQRARLLGLGATGDDVRPLWDIRCHLDRPSSPARKPHNRKEITDLELDNPRKARCQQETSGEEECTQALPLRRCLCI